MTTSRKKNLIVVLGMHRSGTSAVARALKVLGVDLGDHLMAANAVNIKGFWEDIDINELNIELMSSISTDWHHLTTMQKSDVATLRDAGFFPRAEQLLRAKLHGHERFGFKDPRTAKLLPFWNEVFVRLKCQVSYVLVSRHPLSIVKSLTKRDGFEPEKTYLLWLMHILEALSGTSGKRRVLVDYDHLMLDPDREIHRMARSLGFEVDTVSLAHYKTEFLDASLRHSVFDQSTLDTEKNCPPLVRDVYRGLLEVASDNYVLNSKELQQNLVLWNEEFSRIEHAMKLAAQLYGETEFHASVYLATETNDFSEERSVSLSIRMDETDILTLHIADILPGVSRMRLDPCDGFAVIYLDHLQFLSKSGEILRTWSGKPDAEIAMGVTIMAVPGTPGWALICPQNDPWIEFKLPEFTHSIRLSMRRMGSKPLADLLSEVAKSAIVVQIAKASVSERDERIRTLLSAAYECEGQISNLRQMSEDSEVQISNLNHAVAQSEGQISELNRALAECETQLAARNERLEETRLEMEALLRQVQTLAGQLEASREETRQERQLLLKAAQASVAREREVASQILAREQYFHAQWLLFHEKEESVQKDLQNALQSSSERELVHAAQLAARELAHHERIEAFRSEVIQLRQAHESQLSDLHTKAESAWAVKENALSAQILRAQTEAARVEKVLQTMLARSRDEIAAVKASWAWRASASLRWIEAIFTGKTHTSVAKESNQLGLIVDMSIEQRDSGNSDRVSLASSTKLERTDMTGTRFAQLREISPAPPPRADAAQLLEKSEDAYIDAIYAALLQRSPDAEGKLYYQQRLAAGVSKLQILHEIYASQESRKTGVQISGLWEAIANAGLNTADAFYLPALMDEACQVRSAEELLQYDGDQLIQYAYVLLLKRPADAEGMRTCLERLRSGATKRQVIYELFTSPECSKTGGGLPGIRESFLSDEKGNAGNSLWIQTSCRSTIASNLSDLMQLDGSEFVECAYLTLLERAPDVAGFREALGRLLDGVAKVQILADLASSYEARKKAVLLPGLAAAIIRHERAKLPFFGWIFGLIAQQEGSSRLAQRVRAVEQRLLADRSSVEMRLCSIERGLPKAQHLTAYMQAIDAQIDELGRRIEQTSADAEVRYVQFESSLSGRQTIQDVVVSCVAETPLGERHKRVDRNLADVDGTWEWAAYSLVKDQIQNIKRTRKESVKPEPLKMIDIADEDSSTVAQRVILPIPGQTLDVSIIIPVFNNLKLTLECLLSITEKTEAAVTYEVLVADDASTDDSVKVLSEIQNLRVLRSKENLGFLLNCNRAINHARGKYVLFLNNDVQVTDGWLTGLLDTFTRYRDVGAVGPRFVYPSGHLQEAGAAFRPDGSTDMLGVNEDAEQARYSYARRVDYASGACLLLPTELVKELGGFSEEFVLCYCEDSDLCLRLQEKGYFVYYNPAVTIIHHLSKTTAVVDDEFKYRCVSTNLSILANKWVERIDGSSVARVLAFYLPQFHPIPENNAWWGEGFTEWTNVSKARPNFVGHYQPRSPADLGYYDLRVPEVMEQQAELARRNGIDGFCFYYYWFGGKRLLELPLEQMLESRKPDFPFCLCWANENWSRRWDGQQSDILMEQAHSPQDDLEVIADLSRYFRDDRYIRVDGRPLILVYRVPLFPDFASTATRWRSYCRDQGVGEIYIAMVESFDLVHSQTHPSKYGCDAAVEFPPQELAQTNPPTGAVINPKFKGHTADYNELAVRFATRELPAYTRFMGVTPGWDNTARMQDSSYCFEDATPGAFQAWLEEVLDETRKQHFGDERLVFVNAWNEWAEGAYLEPDRRFGHTFLNAVRNAKDSARLLRKNTYGLGG